MSRTVNNSPRVWYHCLLVGNLSAHINVCVISILLGSVSCVVGLYHCKNSHEVIFVRSRVLQATGYKLRDYDGLMATPICVDEASRFLRKELVISTLLTVSHLKR
jgi:hypothetical protein